MGSFHIHFSLFFESRFNQNARSIRIVNMHRSKGTEFRYSIEEVNHFFIKFNELFKNIYYHKVVTHDNGAVQFNQICLQNTVF